jgi:ABC-type sugar transport system permease subunit
LSFKEYTYVTDEAGKMVLQTTFVGFDNIIGIYKMLFNDEMFSQIVGNSLLFYLITTVSGTVISLFSSYYIYKKRFASEFFKTMLFLPGVISTMSVTIMYKFFCEKGVPAIMLDLFQIKGVNFSASFDTQMFYIIVFNFLIASGGHLLIYCGTLAGISDSVVEAAEIDGASEMQEFFYVIIPTIFPTVSLFFVTGLLTIFSGSANMFNFFGKDADKEMWTFGSKLLVSGLIDTAWKEVYQVVIGKCYSPASLGLYTRAKQFADLCSSNLT